MPKIVKIGLRLSKICRKYRKLFFSGHGVKAYNQGGSKQP